MDAATITNRFGGIRSCLGLVGRLLFRIDRYCRWSYHADRCDSWIDLTHEVPDIRAQEGDNLQIDRKAVCRGWRQLDYFISFWIGRYRVLYFTGLLQFVSAVAMIAEQFGGEEPGQERKCLLAKATEDRRFTCDININ